MMKWTILESVASIITQKKERIKRKEQTMSREQIEEMAWDLCDIPMHPNIHSCKECGGNHCHAQYYAERAYNAGYRKQSEGEWEYIATHDCFSCSICKFDSDVTMKYCGGCGAKMKDGA